MAFEKQIRDWKRHRADQRLFRHLASIHQIEAEQLKLLNAIAEEARLVRVSEVFVRPDLFDRNPDRSQFTDRQLARLRKQVIGEPGGNA